jgi:hypothetical protein
MPNLWVGSFDLCRLTFDLERSELVRSARLEPAGFEPQARSRVTDGGVGVAIPPKVGWCAQEGTDPYSRSETANPYVVNGSVLVQAA